jgi:hypothetical protein
VNTHAMGVFAVRDGTVTYTDLGMWPRQNTRMTL